jgi:hypothetical protein
MKPWISCMALAALSVGLYALVQGAHGTTMATPTPVARPQLAARTIAPSSISEDDAPASELALAPPGDASGEQLAHGEAPSSPTSAEIGAYLEAVFASDRPPAPSRDRTSALEQRLRTSMPAGSAVRKLECRDSMCRIETSHPGREELGQLVRSTYYASDPAGVLNGPFFATVLSEAAPGQPLVAVAFVGRQGMQLSMPGLLPAPSSATPGQR